MTSKSLSLLIDGIPKDGILTLVRAMSFDIYVHLINLTLHISSFYKLQPYLPQVFRISCACWVRP